jgi:hypothetical protein
MALTLLDAGNLVQEAAGLYRVRILDESSQEHFKQNFIYSMRWFSSYLVKRTPPIIAVKGATVTKPKLPTKV